MAFDNQSTDTVHLPDGVETSFLLDFYYLEGSTDEIKVELYDITDPTAPVPISLVPGVSYSIDETAYPNTTIDFLVAPVADTKLYIYRQHASGQATNLLGLQFPPETTEDTFDTLAMQIQEIISTLYNVGLNQGHLDPYDINSDFYQFLMGITFRRTTTVATTGDFDATANDIILINTADAVTINLPASSTNGTLITIKDVRGSDVANKVIDAVGDTFPELATSAFNLTSNYQSINLISNGAGSWYIY